MRQAQARKPYNAYLDAPRRSERPHLRVVEDLHVEAPEVEIPEWAEPFADPRWDDRLGEPPFTDSDGRRTVVVTGRPGPQHQPRRERTATAAARMRRQTPTRARLAGRPDRVALWAVALGLLMAAMAGFTGSGHGHASHGSAPSAPAPVFDR
ncbi:MAG: hypothetical protein ACJ76Z_15475 [Thermoleophilaceae bacterium]